MLMVAVVVGIVVGIYEVLGGSIGGVLWRCDVVLGGSVRG